ncbi:MAG: hypothetical protein GY861_04675 [bacterium]|nr:hypothetical protein [bacterium]
MNENNVDKIQIETLEEKECLDRIPSVSDVLDKPTTKEELSENGKDVRIKELESFIGSVVFTMEKAKKHNTLTEHDNMMFREQLARAKHLLEQSK